MSYTNIQLIGYHLDTSPKRALAANYPNQIKSGQFTKVGEYLKLTLTGQKIKEYIGISPDATDIAARIQLMERAFKTATSAKNGSNIYYVSSDSNTLKLFMAPEFFFRGKNGAYPINLVHSIIGSLKALVTGDDWKDWLFVFGTILITYQDEIGRQIINNFALIIKGGSTPQTNIVSKEHMSGIDFIRVGPNQQVFVIAEVHHDSAGKTGPGRESKVVNYDGSGIFTQDDIRMAVEICLDHKAKRLVLSPQLPGEQQIQLQLIPSGGMSIKSNAISLQDGGYVFNVDGMRPSGRADAQELSNNALSPVYGSPPVTVANRDIDLPSSPPTTVKVTDIFPENAGNVVIYQSKVLPAAKKVPGISKSYSYASNNITFTVTLVFNTSNNFIESLFTVQSDDFPFDQRTYFLDVDVELKTDKKKLLVMKVAQEGASFGSYNKSIACDITLYDGENTTASRLFHFEGTVLFFKNSDSSTVQTIWDTATVTPITEKKTTYS